MSSNAIGTIIRIGFIALFVMLLWLLSVLAVYLVVIFIFGLEFSLSTYSILFLLLILLRMFYPKNVFK